MSQRTVAGTTFGYETHGEGTPVFFLHGLPTDRRSMVPRFESLFERADHGPPSSSTGSRRAPNVGASAARGFRRIYPDLPGAGETLANTELRNLDQYVENVVQFMEAESGGERFVLVGTSWGAHIALACAALHAERLLGLALFVPGPGPEVDVKTPARTALVTEAGVLEGIPQPLADAFSAAATVLTRATLDAIASSVAPGGRSADHAYLDKVLKRRLTYHERMQHISFDGPVLVAAGRQDSVCGYAGAWAIAEQFPRATFAVLDRAAHAMQIEQNKLLSALVEEWLARVREGMGEPYPGS